MEDQLLFVLIVFRLHSKQAYYFLTIYADNHCVRTLNCNYVFFLLYYVRVCKNIIEFFNLKYLGNIVTSTPEKQVIFEKSFYNYYFYVNHALNL